MKKMILCLMILFSLFILGCSKTIPPICGNGIIETGEADENCCLDVGCGDSGKVCLGNSCVPPPCPNHVCCGDANCDDGDPSTEDECINPETEEAYCQSTPLPLN